MDSVTQRKERKLNRTKAVVWAFLLIFGAFLAQSIYKAHNAMVHAAYGGRRMTRSEAEELAAPNYRWYRYLLSRLPDSEFLPEKP